ncbi:MAG: ABC transporter substrate-binding protein, partial [Thiohalomonadales bacterium]|nr:ABC transporter substrate-binding protein [Thiohalomonadales bacterium]
RTLLVQTYGVVLLDYSDQEIRYLPLRDDLTSGDVTVRTLVVQSNGETVAINYQLYLRNGEWKVYDISVEGVSLVTNFRTSYATEIKQSGLDSLINRLEAKIREDGQ